jgi:hypothetical protein
VPEKEDSIQLWCRRKGIDLDKCQLKMYLIFS